MTRNNMAVGGNGARVEVPAPKLSHLIAGRIRDRITSGELPRGSNLPSETALLTQMGVSRPVLREALRILEGEGLIRTGRGTRNPVVLGPSIQKSAQFASYLLAGNAVTLSDLHQARLYIEPEIIRELSGESLGLAARQLARCMERWGGRDDITGLHDTVNLSKRFHETLLESASNPIARIMCRMIYEISMQTYHSIDEATTDSFSALVRHIPDQLAAYNQLVGDLAGGDTGVAAENWIGYIGRVNAMLSHSGLGQRPLALIA